MIEFTGYQLEERAKYAIKVWKKILIAIIIFSFAILYIPVVYLIVAIDVIHVLWFLPCIAIILIIVFYRVPPSKYHGVVPYKTVIEDDIVYIEGEKTVIVRGSFAT